MEELGSSWGSSWADSDGKAPGLFHPWSMLRLRPQLQALCPGLSCALGVYNPLSFDPIHHFDSLPETPLNSVLPMSGGALCRPCSGKYRQKFRAREKGLAVDARMPASARGLLMCGAGCRGVQHGFKVLIGGSKTRRSYSPSPSGLRKSLQGCQDLVGLGLVAATVQRSGAGPLRRARSHCRELVDCVLFTKKAWLRIGLEWEFFRVVWLCF